MKRKLRRPPSPTASAASLLAGGVLFTGPASAAVLLNEGFEGVNVFGMPTYLYSQNYTLPNSLTPGGDLRYGTAGPGVTGQVSTNTFLVAPFSLTTGTGITTAQI